MMTVHLPTLKQLQYLVALREHGHFGRAADACFVTQSTLSAGLRELETLLGVTLVERTRRVVRFTALGEQIADKAVRVLREAEELAELARAEGQPLHGELRMGVIPTIAPFLLPAMLPRLRKEWPDLKLYLREETSQAACEALQRGQLDCVLLALPYTLRRRRFRALVRRSPVRRLSRRRGAERRRRRRRRDRREAHAAARGRPLPQGPCALRLQPAGPARPCGDDGDLAAHVGADGRQWPRRDLHPAMAIEAGILDGTQVEARPLRSDHGFRRIALIWRRSSPRETEFQLLAATIRRIIPALGSEA